MAQNDQLKRYLEAGMAFTQMTRERAEAIVKDWVKAGEVRREQAQERVDELVERSRRNTEQLVDIVRTEIAQQLGAMGIATKDDLARLEARLSGPSAASPPKKAPAAKKAAKSKPAAG